MCENSFCVGTVGCLRKSRAPQGRNNTSPGRKALVSLGNGTRVRKGRTEGAQPLRRLSRINAVTPEHFDDPVAAYDRLAVYYADLSRRREPYLRGIEREIISRIPPSTPSLRRRRARPA